MKNILTFFLLTLTTIGFCVGQTDSSQAAPRTASAKRFTATRATYVELTGNGSTFSLNWDQLLRPQAVWKLGVRGGFDFFKLFVRSPQVLVESYVLKGEGNHHFETGIGLTYTILEQYKETINSQEVWQSNGPQLWLVPRVGYRYQRPQGGAVLRIGLTPSLRWGDGNNRRYFMGMGISFGKSF